MSGVLSRCRFLPVYLRRALSSSIQSQPSHEASLKHQPLLDDSWKTAQPAGSTLFPECELFNPFVKPEPRHQWDAIQHSLRCRGISIPFDLHQLSDFKSTLDSIARKISVLDSERRAIHTSFHGNEVPESAKFEIRRLRAEQKELKVSFRALLGRYWKPVLELPNSIHTECPVGNEPRILKTFEPKSTSETVSWNQVKQNLHHTPIGTYKTGLLAELEHSQLDLATTRWLDQDAASFPSVSSYPVSLSDFARGPAVEACA
ncbi:unnamed protein product, partial [Dicrocoelium dendriticum]